MGMTRKQIEALLRMKRRAEAETRKALTPDPKQDPLIEGYKGTVDLSEKTYQVPVIEMTAEDEQEQDEHRKRVLAHMSEKSDDDLDDEESDEEESDDLEDEE